MPALVGSAVILGLLFGAIKGYNGNLVKAISWAVVSNFALTLFGLFWGLIHWQTQGQVRGNPSPEWAWFNIFITPMLVAAATFAVVHTARKWRRKKKDQSNQKPPVNTRPGPGSDQYIY